MSESAQEMSNANTQWQNWHKSITVGGNIEGEFEPKNNAVAPEDTKVQDKDFKGGLDGLLQVVSQALADNKTIRGYGSKWSLDNIAYNNEYLLKTWSLDYLKIGLDAGMVTEAYQSKKDQLCFVQAGVFVKFLNLALLKKELALPTSGASDGQRLIGAISTGTHGSANTVGAMQSFVRGIHLVIPKKGSGNESEHVYIQKASAPAVNDQFAEFLDHTRIIASDELFQAAVVSFGSFGLIHGLLIEAAPLYQLTMNCILLDFDDVQPILEANNRDELGKAVYEVSGLTDSEQLPFHFEMSLNPYHLNRKRGGAFIRVFRKEPFQGDLPEVIEDQQSLDRDDHNGIHESMGAGITNAVIKDALAVEEAIDPRDGKKKLYGLIIQGVLKSFFKIPLLRRRSRTITDVPSKFFSGKHSAEPYHRAPVGGTSLEISIPLAYWKQAVEVILTVAEAHPIAAPMGMRVVKPTQATIGFTRWNDLTVTIEMPGPWGKEVFTDTGDIHQLIFQAMNDSGIPHAFHWGQQMPANTQANQWLERAYGNALGEWQKQRAELLDEKGQHLFSNQMTRALGITE